MDKEDLLYLLRDPEVRHAIFKIVCRELLDVVKRESKGGQSVAEYAIQSAIESAVQSALSAVGVKDKKHSAKKHRKNFDDDFAEENFDELENSADDFDDEENFDSQDDEEFFDKPSRRRSRDFDEDEEYFDRKNHRRREYDEDDEEDYHDRKPHRRHRDFDDDNDDDYFDDDDYTPRRPPTRRNHSSAPSLKHKFPPSAEKSTRQRESVTESHFEQTPDRVIPSAAERNIPREQIPDRVIPSAAERNIPREQIPDRVIPSAAERNIPREQIPDRVIPSAAERNIPRENVAEEKNIPTKISKSDDNIKIPARQREEKIVEVADGDDNIKIPARQHEEKIVEVAEGDDNIKIPARQREEKIVEVAEGDDNIKIPARQREEKVVEVAEKPAENINHEKFVEMAATAAKVVTTSAEREKIMAQKEEAWRKIVEERKKAVPKTEDLVASLLAQQAEEEKAAQTEKNFNILKENALNPDTEVVEHFHGMSGEPIDKFTLVLERPCPVCENLTRVVKTKTRQIVDTRDVDLCIHYKNFNPYLYYVWACENCGYAAEETKFLSPMPKRTRGRIKSFLISNNLVMPFIRERSLQEAMSFYEMAILFSEAFEPSMARQAGLYQKMAWIQRYEGNKEKEFEYMKKTAELYEESFGKERYPVGNVTDTTALYVTAATHFLLGDFEKSTKDLSRIIENQSLRSSNPNLYDRARDLWQEIRKNKNKK